MAQSQWLLLCLISAAAYVSVTMADENAHQTLGQSPSASIATSTPALSPSPPVIRKLGMHNPSKVNSKSSDATTFSPSSALAASTSEASETEESLSIPEQEIHLKIRHINLPLLATTFFVAVFSYIRATARHKASATSTTGS
ncbi:unnamed protein product [Malus baccata var. baccata]